jgi:hypothetical protein
VGGQVEPVLETDVVRAFGRGSAIPGGGAGVNAAELLLENQHRPRVRVVDEPAGVGPLSQFIGKLLVPVVLSREFRGELFEGELPRLLLDLLKVLGKVEVH